MADINLTITIPDAYVSRLRDAIDKLDPLPGGVTYPAQFKNIIRRWTKAYVKKSESLTALENIAVDDGVIT